MKEATREKYFKAGQECYEKAQDLIDRRKIDEALLELSKAEKSFQKIKDLHWTTFLGHEKIRLFKEKKEYKKAQRLSDKVIKGYLETKNPSGLILFLTYYSSLYIEQDQEYLAIENLKAAEALAVKEKTAQNLDYVYSNLALVYFRIENYARCIHYLKKAVKLYQERENLAEVGRCETHLGICFHKIFRTEEAEQSFLTAHRAYLELGLREEALEVLERLNEMYLEANRFEKSRNLQKTIRLVQQKNLAG